MGGFTEAVQERVRAARAALAAALEADDAYQVAVAQDELDDAVRIARAHGIDDDPGAEVGAGEGTGADGGPVTSASGT
ncbi:hypothetical protein ABZX38_25095 [Streptomyces longwoodensis]|uniref:hypothetical protein n=1 Tax=Streptomyces longwoodensis TaxID=68231 RepID=UPI0033BB9032